jgi:hypothetical protein
MKPTIVTLTGGDENTKTVATYEEAFGGEYSEAEGGDWQDYSFEGEDLYLSAEGEEFLYNAEGDYFYNAKGEKFKKGMGKVGKGFKKVGKGIGSAGKWVGKQFKKFVGKLKPKKGARKLRQDKRADKRTQKQKAYAEKKAKRDKDIAEAKAKGQLPPPPLPPPTPEERGSGSSTSMPTKPVDVIPPVINGEKQNPDGSKTAVPPQDQTKVGDQIVDKKDLVDTQNVTVQTNPETGVKEIVAEVDPSKVETLTTEDGEQIAFKKSDLIENKPEGMSKGMKIGLIVGGSLIVLGIVSYFIFKGKGTAKAK